MIQPRQFRDLMAGVCAPVTVVTTMTDGVPHGATVSSFASLSLNPPLVSVAFDRGSALLRQIQAAGRFGVNILGHAQDELAVTFARRGDLCRHAKKHLPPEHPCPVANCDRKGDEAFYRRDKLYDHLRKKHKMMI